MSTKVENTENAATIDGLQYVRGILSDFANFLWDFGKLEMKTQIPPFETPEKLVNWYLSIYEKDGRKCFEK